MQKDIRFLLFFLIIALGVLVWIQSYYCSPIPVPNQGQLTNDNTQHFTVNNDKLSKSKLIDDILYSEKHNNVNYNDNLSELKSLDESLITNPLREELNNSSIDDEALDELIKEVNTGNNLNINNSKSELYKSKSRSINAANKYRKISYKDSNYRYDFNDDGSPSNDSQSELDSLYNDAMIFKNNDYNNNNNFVGYSDNSQNFGNANLNDFKSSEPQSQQEKIMALYNSNEYLPNNDLLDKKLTKGFQILDNPVAVSNPSLIPVLKSIPVSSVMGSNRNQTYDIRAEPPCPKTVVSPFLNSTIMPDIYSTQRGCL